MLVEDGLVTGLYFVRNPDKLARLDEVVAADPLRLASRAVVELSGTRQGSTPVHGTSVLRVRTSRRPSEPAPVSTGEGSPHEVHVVRSQPSRRAHRARPDDLGLLAGRASETTTASDASKRVVLVTHESFVLPKELQKQFEEESGYDLVVQASGDAGALTNKLVLTKDDPTGDVAFGVDNTFALPGPRRGRVRAVRRDAAGRRRRLRAARATTSTGSRRSTTATSASTSTTPGSPTTTWPRRRPSTT